jgi:small subunit ribosomal protein S4
MARITGPKCRICRRAGEQLFLRGDRCHGPKCAIARRPSVPGPARYKRRRRTTEYGVRLREKQKVKQHYGVLDRQFRVYFSRAQRMPGNTGEHLLVLLERRLDNVVMRAGFGSGPNQSRQFVRHGHITVNGRRVDLPSYLVRPGDVVGVCSNERSRKVVKDIVGSKAASPPSWLTVDQDALTARVANAPTREDVPIPVNEQLIVEFCSR